MTGSTNRHLYDDARRFQYQNVWRSRYAGMLCVIAVIQVYGLQGAVDKQVAQRDAYVILMLSQRRRRWPSIKTTLGERLMFGEVALVR